MYDILMMLSVLVLLVLALYAQRRVPAFTQGRGKILMVRTVLVVVGIGTGLVSTMAMQGTVGNILSFLMGFGLVHVPAAVILFIKGQRGAGKT